MFFPQRSKISIHTLSIHVPHLISWNLHSNYLYPPPPHFKHLFATFFNNRALVISRNTRNINFWFHSVIHLHTNLLMNRRYIGHATAVNEHKGQWRAYDRKERIWTICALKIGVCDPILAYFPTPYCTCCGVPTVIQHPKDFKSQKTLTNSHYSNYLNRWFL